LWLIRRYPRSTRRSRRTRGAARAACRGRRAWWSCRIQTRTRSRFVCTSTGGSSEPPDAAGIAHLVEHVVISGNPEYGDLAATGRGFGYVPYVNAFTEFDRTVYQVSSSLEEVDDRPAILALLWYAWALLYNRPAFGARFEAEQSIVAEELRLRDTPLSRADLALLPALTGEPAMGDWMAAQRAAIGGLTVGDARRFYRAAYRSPQATLVVVTGRAVDVTEPLVRGVFRSVRPRDTPAAAVPPPLAEWDARVAAVDSVDDVGEGVLWSATRPHVRTGTWADARTRRPRSRARCSPTVYTRRWATTRSGSASPSAGRTRQGATPSRSSAWSVQGPISGYWTG
jgi:hypothetical protein